MGHNHQLICIYTVGQCNAGRIIQNCNQVITQSMCLTFDTRKFAGQDNAVFFLIVTSTFRSTSTMLCIPYTLIKDPPRKGQPPYKGCSSGPLSRTFLTAKKRTTSQQRTKWLIPRCPLFGGSTVVHLDNLSTKDFFTSSQILQWMSLEDRADWPFIQRFQC